MQKSAALSTVLADQINAAHEACVQATANAVRYAIECGALLLQAKAELEHGEFGQWVAGNCSLTWRHAQNYMKMARNAKRVSHLPSVRQALNVHFSSESAEWYTPPAVIERVVTCLRSIDLDPCSNSASEPAVPAALHFTQEDDGLTRLWAGRVYMNPPYGREIDDWANKLCSEYAAGNVTEAIALIPARVDTDWFRRFRDAAVCFIDGRLKFSGHENSAPFPSAVVYLGERVNAFCAAFADIGDIWVRVKSST